MLGGKAKQGWRWVRVGFAVSGGIPDRRADLKQDFSDLMQEGLDRTTTGQMQVDAILILNHPHGDLLV